MRRRVSRCVLLALLAAVSAVSAAGPTGPVIPVPIESREAVVNLGSLSSRLGTLAVGRVVRNWQLTGN